MQAGLSSEDARLVDEIFAHPTSHNIEWRRVRALLERIGEFEEEHNGKWKGQVNGVSFHFGEQHGKDVPVEEVERLRHVLADAGLTPGR